MPHSLTDWLLCTCISRQGFRVSGYELWKIIIGKIKIDSIKELPGLGHTGFYTSSLLDMSPVPDNAMHGGASAHVMKSAIWHSKKSQQIQTGSTQSKTNQIMYAVQRSSIFIW